MLKLCNFIYQQFSLILKNTVIFVLFHLKCIMTFFKNLPKHFQLFLVLAIWIPISIILVYSANGLVAAIIASLILCFLIYIGRRIWFPPDYSRTKVRLYSLYAALTLALTYAGWKPLIEKTLIAFLKQKYPDLLASIPSQQFEPGFIFGFLFLVIVVVNYWNRGESSINKTLSPVEKAFPEWDFNKEKEGFIRVLKNQLQKINQETNWSDDNFIQLETEVSYGETIKLKAPNLIDAIKKYPNANTILILGEPGSGKSVSLRKLAFQMLEEGKNSNVIPIYIDLKSWRPEKENWSKNNPPKAVHLYDFIYKAISGIEPFLDDFLKSYFKRMFKNGNLFFILDSFDEIPCILDCEENSWIINKLSETIHDFLLGAHLSKGILASRLYKAPSISYRHDVEFEILPFTEKKIHLFFNKALDSFYLKELFNNNDLLNAAKNPFTASLILSYIINNKAFPPNRFSLYSEYVNKKIDNLLINEKEISITRKNAIQTSSFIAKTMFNNENYALEIPIEKLNELEDRLPIELTIILLEKVKLARIGNTKKPNFSFSHRRFNEYFLLLNFQNHPELIPYNSIFENSRWRDTLVLFAEIADETIATKIANQCWSKTVILKKRRVDINEETYIHAIHALRFLVDAFKSRTECLIGFSNSLADLILEKIENKGDLLEIKLAIEGTGLVPKERIEPILIKAFEFDHSWIHENIISACRYLPKISSELSLKIFKSIINNDNFRFFPKKMLLEDEINLFSLNNTFSEVVSWLKRKKLENIVFMSMFLGFTVLMVYSVYEKGGFFGISVVIFWLITVYPFFAKSFNEDSILNFFKKIKNFKFPKITKESLVEYSHFIFWLIYYTTLCFIIPRILFKILKYYLNSELIAGLLTMILPLSTIIIFTIFEMKKGRKKAINLIGNSKILERQQIEKHLSLLKYPSFKNIYCNYLFEKKILFKGNWRYSSSYSYYLYIHKYKTHLEKFYSFFLGTSRQNLKECETIIAKIDEKSLGLNK